LDHGNNNDYLLIYSHYFYQRKKRRTIVFTKRTIWFIVYDKKVFQEKNILLLLLLFVVFIHNAAYQIAQTFFSSYAEELLHFPAEKSATILGIFVIFQIVLSLFGGILTKYIGVTNFLIPGSLLFLGGFPPLSVISCLSPDFFGRVITLNNGLFGSWQFYFYFLAILVMAFSWLLLFMNLLLVIWNIAPQQNIGMFTAFYYVFWNLAAILSPLLAGGFFDLIGYLTRINGLQTLFLLISAIYLVALLILFIIRCKQIKVFHKKYI